jgi:hypothetical protein
VLGVAGNPAAAAPAAAAAAREPHGGSVGIRLVDAPVSRRDDPRAHVYIVDHVSPGDTIRRRVEVTNTSDLPHRIALYPAAATVDETGFSFAPDRAGNDLTTWVRLERTGMTLPAGSQEMVWATIAVPRTAPAGERYAVLWAQVAATTDPAANVRNVGRVGVRIYLSVGAGGEPASGFEIDGVTGARDPAGVPIVTVKVRNTGGRALDLDGKLSLSDGPGALSAGPFRVNLGTLGIGDTAEGSVRLDPQLPDGPWTAELSLASGPATRTATASVAFTESPARPASNRGTAVLTLSGVLALAAAMLLAGYTYYAYRRRRPDHQVPAG